MGVSPFPVEPNADHRWRVSELGWVLRLPAGIRELLVGVGTPPPTCWNWVQELFPTACKVIPLTTFNQKEEQERSNSWGNRGNEQQSKFHRSFLYVWKLRNRLFWTLVFCSSCRKTKWRSVLIICAPCSPFSPRTNSPLVTLPGAQGCLFWPESVGLPGPRVCADVQARGGAPRSHSGREGRVDGGPLMKADILQDPYSWRPYQCQEPPSPYPTPLGRNDSSPVLTLVFFFTISC